MKKVYKYGTGQTIPKGAVYLNTEVENREINTECNARFVWHYFLVEVDEE